MMDFCVGWAGDVNLALTNATSYYVLAEWWLLLADYPSNLYEKGTAVRARWPGIKSVGGLNLAPRAASLAELSSRG